MRWLKLLKNFDDRASQSAQAEAYQKKEIKRLKVRIIRKYSNAIVLVNIK